MMTAAMVDRAATGTFDIVRADVLDAVPHGFFGSSGGSHHFGYGGPGDDAEVRRLRASAAHAIAPGALPACPKQVHGADVVTLDVQWADGPDSRPQADGIVTTRIGVAIGIVTADCVPVLFADTTNGVIGAAHAGWRGAVGGVIENTLAAMENLGARRDRIRAAIGPAIAQSSYEVDTALYEKFDAADESYFRTAPPRDGEPRWHLDLPGYVGGRLDRWGIAHHQTIAHDTYSRPGQYHSYRRQMRDGKTGYCNQISMIALPSRH